MEPTHKLCTKSLRQKNNWKEKLKKQTSQSLKRWQKMTSLRTLTKNRPKRFLLARHSIDIQLTLTIISQLTPNSFEAKVHSASTITPLSKEEQFNRQPKTQHWWPRGGSSRNCINLNLFVKSNGTISLRTKNWWMRKLFIRKRRHNLMKLKTGSSSSIRYKRGRNASENSWCVNVSIASLIMALKKPTNILLLKRVDVRIRRSS